MIFEDDRQKPNKQALSKLGYKLMRLVGRRLIEKSGNEPPEAQVFRKKTKHGEMMWVDPSYGPPEMTPRGLWIPTGPPIVFTPHPRKKGGNE